MRVGFTLTTLGDAASVEIGRHPGPDPFVSFARTSDLAAVALGRLYYTEDLSAALARVGVDLPENASPAGWALAAYRAWGEAFAGALEGDISVAVWDRAQRRLLAARDPFGGYPLFWTYSRAGVSVGTGLPALLSRSASRDLDPEYLAAFLALEGQLAEVPGERTAYQAVRRVGPGTTLAFAAGFREGPRVAHQHGIADDILMQAGDDFEAIAPIFRDRLERAIRERAVGATATHCSGGMDSTVVALLAASLTTGPVRGLSLVYHRLRKLSGERRYVDAAFAAEPRLVPDLIPADDLLDFDDVVMPPPHDEPFAGLWRSGMGRAVLAWAAELGISTVLTGFGADEQLAHAPYYLARLVRRGRLIRAWSESGRWAQAWNCNRWDVLAEFARLRRRRAAWESIPTWIRPVFARRHNLAERVRERSLPRLDAHPESRVSAALSALNGRVGDASRWAVAVSLGVATAHPFLDPRVVAVALGALTLPPQPDLQKPLLSAAMADRLPASIRGRRAKGHFDEVFHLGLARNLPRLIDLVESAPEVLDEIFDRPALIQGLETAAYGGAEGRASHSMTLSLCLSCWLAHREQWHRTPPQPDEVIPI